jgi:hypothetical protein
MCGPACSLVGRDFLCGCAFEVVLLTDILGAGAPLGAEVDDSAVGQSQAHRWLSDVSAAQYARMVANEMADDCQLIRADALACVAGNCQFFARPYSIGNRQCCRSAEQPRHTSLSSGRSTEKLRSQT